MISKDKAEQLVDRYNVLQTFIENFDYEHAKECALIAVDEIISNIKQSLISNTALYNGQLTYWQEVKQEIEKL